MLGCEACGWLAPANIIFDLSKVTRALQEPASLVAKSERFKAVLRTGIDRWHLVQRWNADWSIAECAWRQDSRMEVQMPETAAVEWREWDDLWRSVAAEF